MLTYRDSVLENRAMDDFKKCFLYFSEILIMLLDQFLKKLKIKHANLWLKQNNDCWNGETSRMDGTQRGAIISAW